MNLTQAVLTNNEEEFNKILQGDCDLDFVAGTGITILWIAINGSTSRPKVKNTNFANYNMIASLLAKGANPNKRCCLITPLYVAAFHSRLDIVRLLLIHGANPNEPSLIQFRHKLSFYELPLNIAFREFDLELVELLLLYSALYNKITIEKVKYGINLALKGINTHNYTSYKKLKKILQLLESNYNNDFETKVLEIISKSVKPQTFQNYHSCFEKYFPVRNRNFPNLSQENDKTS